MESEGKKRSAILEAEGIKESHILTAKGEAEAKVIRAESEAIARLKITEAEAQAIGMIKTIAPDCDALSYLIAQQYVKTLPELMAGKDDKLVVVPYEATSVLGSLVGMKKLFEWIK